jgi:ornithine carbamoyltransferase
MGVLVKGRDVLKGRHLLSISDISDEDFNSFMAGAVELKARGNMSLLEGKVLALLFEKPSLRTRVSFEVAMRQLGGEVVYLSPAEVGLGERESVADVARVLGRYVDAISARTFSHKTVEELARSAGVPVINALSDLEHPCQALADLLTVYEKKGGLKGVTLAFIGDGNNIAHSLLLATVLAGMNFRIASPAGHTVQEGILRKAKEYAAITGAGILCTQEPSEAVREADVVYTDVWTSMGQEEEVEERRRTFAGYQVNAGLLGLAGKDAIFDQAENRMHAQKALLVRLLAEAGSH